MSPRRPAPIDGPTHEWRERLVCEVRGGETVRGTDSTGFGYTDDDDAFTAHRPIPDGYGGVYIGDHATGAYGPDERVLIWTKVAKMAPIRSMR
jgi:hypothetical protein